jgi:hypothetical protein
MYLIFPLIVPGIQVLLIQCFAYPLHTFALVHRFLEQRMYERFRIINRFDPVTSAPGEIQGYQHFRPAVW